MDTLLSRLGGEGVMATVLILLAGNIALRFYSMYLDHRDRSKIANAAESAACHFPPDMVPSMRAAVLQQKYYADRQQNATIRLETSIERLTKAQERFTEKVIEALAEVRSGR